jgi:chromosome segregation ATPase
MLLTSESTGERAEPTGGEAPAACDLETVETRLFEALDGLDGVAEEVVDEERRRVETLLERLHEMQSRLDEMDRLLDRPEFDEARIQTRLERIGADEASANDRRIESLHNRLEHTRRLRRMRSRLHDEFESALFKIDEISSNMALLTLTDRPGDELADSIEEVAATVEGLSEELLSA